MNNDVNKLESLLKRKKNIDLTLESAKDRKERYADLMNRVTFSKKKLSRQAKILKRYSVAEKLELEMMNYQDLINNEIAKLEQK